MGNWTAHWRRLPATRLQAVLLTKASWPSRPPQPPGIIAALIDAVIQLQTATPWFMFGMGLISALNGPTSIFAKGKESIAATVMSAVTGFVALLAWWIITKIAGERDYGYNPADALNLLEVLVCGVVVGLLSYGWFVLLRRLPSRIAR